uniref:Uncharacterized protein n=1 Tax=Rhizophora mucronata TaxID=61149 RepID=A0A2P2QBW4_RHIMU
MHTTILRFMKNKYMLRLACHKK